MSLARRIRSAGSLPRAVAVAVASGMTAAPAAGEYVKPVHVISVSTDAQWLYDAAGDGVEAGAKAVAEDLLTGVADALVRSYAPEVADLLFGGRDELERHTQRIIEEIQGTHRDLARRHRELLDEIMDQFSVDLIGRLRSASDLMSSWLASDDLLRRSESADVVRDAVRDLNVARTTLEEYVTSDASPEIQYRRLQLLELHITAAQLAVTASRHYWGTVSIRTAFQRSSLGGDESRFDEWIDSLSEADLAAIEVMSPEFDRFQADVYEQVLAFYEAVAEDGAVSDYVERIFTPPVSQMEVFKESTALYDNPDVVTADASWGLRGEGGAFVRLDGLRWYYYADITEASCLEGWAFDALVERDTLPWREVAGEPAASECNRFWIVDPYMSSSGWPNTSLGSLDAYALWFEDGTELYEVHRELIHGDLVRAIYGPVSLVLDRMHLELHGTPRPENRWDRLFEAYDARVAMLGVAESYTDGRSWEQVTAARDALREWGGTPDTLGLRDWFGALKTYVSAPHEAAESLLAIKLARDRYDWMYHIPSPRTLLGVREPVRLTPADVRLALLGPESVYARFGGEEASSTADALAPRFRGEAAAKLTAAS